MKRSGGRALQAERIVSTKAGACYKNKKKMSVPRK